MRVEVYEAPGPISHAFLMDESFVRGIMGPFGSGKSSACVIDILRRSHLQRPSKDGIRHTRWAIIRNSYPELKSTTIKTWGDWCPLQYGKITFDSPICHRITMGDLDIEVFFLALDSPEDVRKLLSLELTGAWINEAREVPKEILDAVTARVGRFPSMKDGGPTWSGILMDTNPPDDQHWWYDAAEVNLPKGWRFFRQPGGRDPNAENKRNLLPNYYERLSAGKSPDWINVYVDSNYGYVVEGKPVYDQFRDSTHVAAIEPNPHFELSIACDFGLTPAAVIGQQLPDGRWIIVDEVVTDNSGVVRFAETLAKYVGTHYPDFSIGMGYGDPAGDARGSDERTAFDIMREYTGWDWKPAPSNDIPIRLEVVMNCLNRMVDGKPGILLSPKCKTLRKGFNGSYCYAPFRTGNGRRFHDKPAKNVWSHIQDALQYLLLGGGEKSVVLNRVNRQNTPRQSRIAPGTEYDPFSSSSFDPTD